MKLHILGFLVALSLPAAPAAPEATIIERGPHYAIWQQTAPYGKRYHEIATGKFHRRGDQWFPSVPEISVLPSGFGVATQLQHKVIFAPNINTWGAIDLLMPDEPQEKRLRVHVLGIAYANKRTGEAVMIASVKNSTGVLIANNQVLYPDAFDTEGGFRIDIRYTVTLAGLEQDIILVEQPPHPAIYNIPIEDCRMEVFSEAVESPQPTKETVILKREPDLQARQAMTDPDLVEEKLIFGEMRMDQGFAFSFGDNENSIPMAKTWEVRENRQLLIERADYADLAPELARLPQVAKVQNPKKPVLLKVGQASLPPQWASLLPACPPRAHAAAPKLRTREMAQLTLPRQGLVLDWQAVITQTNFTFEEITYYVSSDVSLSGTTTLKPAVIKFSPTNGPRLLIKGPIACLTTPFRPGYFTARDDDTIGEAITGSLGSPGTNYYGSTRSIELNSSGTAFSLHDLQFRYLNRSLSISAGTLELARAQIGLGDSAIYKIGGPATPIALRNVLIYNMLTAFSVPTTNRTIENCTFHRVKDFQSAPGTTAYATNCLLVGVTNNVNLAGINNTNVSDSGVFQTAGYGQRYLANTSPYRNAGTTNINPSLLADLRKMTTYPPLPLANDITVPTTLTPQAQRDTDAVDLGYHYLAADWLVGGLSVTGATLTVKGGATVLIDAANTNWGIRLQSGGALVSDGDPVNLNRFVRTHSVQEVPAGSGTNTVPIFADTYPPPASAATVNLRFTDVPQIQNHFAFNQASGQGTLSTLILRDSQFAGGTNCLQPAATNQFMGWTNVLVENSGWFVNSNTASTLHLRNATFKSGVLNLNVASGCTWSVKDSAFDYTAVTNSGSGTLDHDYNGYLTNAVRFASTAANDVVLATNTVNFQTGPLGAYYLPSGSLFIDAGSVTNAGFVGLWHYTTQTNQNKDAGTRLDLGFHYVAVNANGQPIDSDGDTYPDYREDANGNGAFDTGETDWQTYNSPNGLSGGSGLQVYTPLKP